MNVAAPDRRPLRIRGPALRRALIAGALRVIADRDVLNRINVFPVPDGDTGSNLAFTLGSVLTGALSRRTAGAGPLLRQVGEEAIDGARGNSGAILAQFLSGVADGVGDRMAVGPAELSAAVRLGGDAARQALSEPREGTILSVIDAFADGLQPVGRVDDVAAWFAPALARARQALADTPTQLAVLQRAGVVDAGAQGFVDLLEGIAAFIADRRTVECEAGAEDRLADLEAAQAHEQLLEADPDHRWCSECLLLGGGLDRAGLRAAVGELGASCVVIAGSQTRVRLHAHVADPQALFALAARFGRVESTKADDMHAQARTAAGGGRVAIVTDSSADLPEGLAEALNIHVVPLRLNFGDEDYLDKVGLTPSEFYRKLREEVVLPRTSQPAPGDFRRQFDFLLSHHPALVYLGVSRAVSGTIQSAETAASRGHPERTNVFDSANAAGGLALLAIAAGEAAQRGGDVASILAMLEPLRAQTFTWAMTRDLTMAVRGGRVPAWGRWLVQGLGLTPVAKVTPAGKLSLAGGLVGRRHVPERFARYVARRVDRTRRWRVIVGHCDAPAEGEMLLAALRRELDCAQSWLVETGPAVGAHAGPGALVASLQPA